MVASVHPPTTSANPTNAETRLGSHSLTGLLPRGILLLQPASHQHHPSPSLHLPSIPFPPKANPHRTNRIDRSDRACRSSRRQQRQRSQELELPPLSGGTHARPAHRVLPLVVDGRSAALCARLLGGGSSSKAEGEGKRQHLAAAKEEEAPKRRGRQESFRCKAATAPAFRSREGPRAPIRSAPLPAARARVVRIGGAFGVPLSSPTTTASSQSSRLASFSP